MNPLYPKIINLKIIKQLIIFSFYLFNSYEKYLKQVQSDRKKLFPFTKATKLPDLKKEGSVQGTLAKDQEVLVQIVKEPINTKGPRLTSELSFAGRFLVLVPFGDKVSVSSKIKSSEERARLKQLVHSIKPKNCGVIVRTVAEGKRVFELDAELKTLSQRWEQALLKLQKNTERPLLVYEEESRAIALIRDIFNPSFEAIPNTITLKTRALMRIKYYTLK